MKINFRKILQSENNEKQIKKHKSRADDLNSDHNDASISNIGDSHSKFK
jgi:hypothetical protein